MPARRRWTVPIPVSIPVSAVTNPADASWSKQHDASVRCRPISLRFSYFSQYLLGPPPSILASLQGPEDEPAKTRKRRATLDLTRTFFPPVYFCLFPLRLFPPLLFGIREHTFPPPRHRPLRLVGPASPFFGLPLSCSTPIFSFPPPFPSLPPLHLLQTCLLSNSTLDFSCPSYVLLLRRRLMGILDGENESNELTSFLLFLPPPSLFCAVHLFFSLVPVHPILLTSLPLSLDDSSLPQRSERDSGRSVKMLLELPFLPPIFSLVLLSVHSLDSVRSHSSCLFSAGSSS